PARHGYGMAFCSALQQVVLVGGDAGGLSGASTDTWTWDGSAWSQRTTTPLPTGREEIAITDDPTHGELVLFGGTDGVPISAVPTGGVVFESDTFVYTSNNIAGGNTLAWQPATPAPV